MVVLSVNLKIEVVLYITTQSWVCTGNRAHHPNPHQWCSSGFRILSNPNISISVVQSWKVCKRDDYPLKTCVSWMQVARGVDCPADCADVEPFADLAVRGVSCWRPYRGRGSRDSGAAGGRTEVGWAGRLEVSCSNMERRWRSVRPSSSRANPYTSPISLRTWYLIGTRWCWNMVLLYKNSRCCCSTSRLELYLLHSLLKNN